MKDLAVFKKYGDRLLFALALAVLAAALFRLGGKKAIIEVTATDIVFTQWWQDDLEKDTLRDLVTEFESLHEGIRVTLDTRPYADLRRDLFNSAEAAAGDIIALDPLWAPELVKRKTVEDAEAPFFSFINVLFFNTEILREADFSRPPKTRSEFLACAKAVTDRNKNRWAITFGGDPGSVYCDVYSWFWAAGAPLIKDGKPALNSRPAVETLSFLASLRGEGFIAPASFTGGNPAAFSGGESGAGAEKLEDFVSGRAAFMIAPVNFVKLVRGRMRDGTFGITSIPAPDAYAGKTYYGSAAWTVGINAASAHKEEAALFADFLNGKISLLSEKAGAVPGSAASPPPANDPFYSKAWDIAIAGENAQDFYGLAGARELEVIFREELSALFAGKTAPDAAAAIQERWEAFLAEGK